MEFGYSDEQLLSRLGINRDKLGPRLVACRWDEALSVEVGGYLVVDRLAMGSPAMGGTRMLSDVAPADIHNLARGMSLKNGIDSAVSKPADMGAIRLTRSGRPPAVG